ncbi:MAG: universal stress protein [Myxococcota bacterium]
MAIIVATALEPHDHEARELAGMLAKRMGETIILAHVLEHDEPSPQVMREMLDRATHEITRFGADAYHVLLRGDPTTALTDYARRVCPRLVIIGGPAPSDARGLGQRRKARHLVDALGVPVLCVPHSGELLRVLLEHEPFRVLVAAGLNAKADDAMLREAQALQRVLACDVSASYQGHDHDLVVLDARLLEARTAWPFAEAAKPMLFVSELAHVPAASDVGSERVTSGKNEAASRSSSAQSVIS